MNLSEKTCQPCRGGVAPMEGAQASALLAELSDGWQIEDRGHLLLAKTFTFKNFAEALAFANRIGALAEEQAHHPDLHISWGRVRLEIWTHKIKGLTESDFIFAARADRAL